MLVLAIRSDNPEAEVGLFDGNTQLGYEKWTAGRQLSQTLHRTIASLLAAHGKHLEEIEGVVCFKGPGSFTGLRIGITVADAFAYGLGVPIVATLDEGWVQTGIARLQAGEDERIAIPYYGAPVHITQQKR